MVAIPGAEVSTKLRESGFKELVDVLDEKLPMYARPLFIRVLGEAIDSSLTSTFKLKKSKLRDDGCDPGKCSGDEVWWRAPGADVFTILESGQFAKFSKVRF